MPYEKKDTNDWMWSLSRDMQVCISTVYTKLKMKQITKSGVSLKNLQQISCKA